jgi:hypothetical protein
VVDGVLGDWLAGLHDDHACIARGALAVAGFERSTPSSPGVVSIGAMTSQLGIFRPADRRVKVDLKKAV